METKSSIPAGGDQDDLVLEHLIEIGESRQVPALHGGADADFTVPGPEGVRMRFPGQGTREGDKVLERAVEKALQGIDAKRERESRES